MKEKVLSAIRSIQDANFPFELVALLDADVYAVPYYAKERKLNAEAILTSWPAGADVGLARPLFAKPNRSDANFFTGSPTHVNGGVIFYRRNMYSLRFFEATLADMEAHPVHEQLAMNRVMFLPELHDVKVIILPRFWNCRPPSGCLFKDFAKGVPYSSSCMAGSLRYILIPCLFAHDKWASALASDVCTRSSPARAPPLP